MRRGSVWAACGVATVCAGLLASGATVLHRANTEQTLGAYSTTLNGRTEEQLSNIAKAARLLDGCRILPGHEFSAARAFGPTTAAKGWKKAHAFIGDGVEDAVAGGICQVSSTLYNAALLASMTITERHAHSRPVQSVPVGRDATVAWGIADLKFRNTTVEPVRIRAKIAGSRLTVEIAGATSGGSPVNLLTTQKRVGSRLIATLWRQRADGRELVSTDEYRLPSQ